MVASNFVKYESRDGNTKDWAKCPHTYVNYESLLLRLLQDRHIVVCDPELDAAHNKINACDGDKRSHVVAPSEHVANLLASCVVCRPFCFDDHLSCTQLGVTLRFG